MADSDFAFGRLTEKKEIEAICERSVIDQVWVE